jgi:hypothetical protein
LFEQLKKFLTYDERKRFYEIAENIINELPYDEKEHAFVIRGKHFNYEELIRAVGTKNKIEFTDEEIKRIDDEDALTLSMIHNHTNYSALSYDDFLMLIIHGNIRNMIAIGVSGSLYFAQNTNPKLHFSYSDKDSKDKLRKKLRKACAMIATRYLIEICPSLEPKICWEIISRSKERKDKVDLIVSHKYFLRTCKEYNINYYPSKELI